METVPGSEDAADVGTGREDPAPIAPDPEPIASDPAPDPAPEADPGPVVPDPNGESEPEVGSTPELPDHVPQTGDNSQLGLWITLMLLSAMGTVLTAVVFRRKYKRFK